MSRVKTIAEALAQLEVKVDIEHYLRGAGYCVRVEAAWAPSICENCPVAMYLKAATGNPVRVNLEQAYVGVELLMETEYVELPARVRQFVFDYTIRRTRHVKHVAANTTEPWK